MSSMQGIIKTQTFKTLIYFSLRDIYILIINKNLFYPTNLILKHL